MEELFCKALYIVTYKIMAVESFIVHLKYHIAFVYYSV